ncbi:DUF4180 domain-containing protein [Trinickia sp. NRRL B-1857]|uniref:DUF4180 domain-containing protein n=1 Tax=Trinickia sp. NRRL B-1857 TaxID=3162879 RepID=UPI003D29A792
MDAKLIERDSTRIVHITGSNARIETRQDALDAVFSHGHTDLAGIAIDQACLHPDFFELKTGVAGEILQMFVNYRTAVAIVGVFSHYESDSLRDFIVESNRGRHVFFAADIDDAIARLTAANR